jgi:hypothetical protein
MTRRVLASALFAFAAFALLANADPQGPASKTDPKAPEKDKLDVKSSIDNLAAQQIRMQALYSDFESALRRLAQRMAASPKPEDRDRAKILQQALEKASEEGINNSFDKLITILKAADKEDQAAIEKAMTETEDLSKRLRAILALLDTDNRDAELRKQIEIAQRRLEELKRLIREQDNERTRTELNRANKDQLGKEQGKITKDTKDLAEGKGKGKGDGGEAGKAGAKPGDAKGEGKAGDAKKGDPKNDTGEAKGGEKKPTDAKDPMKDAKPGDGKGEGKSQAGGDPKNGQKADGKGEGKPQAGDPKDQKKGDQKNEGKPSDSKKGDAKDQKGDSKGKADGKGEGKPSDSKSGSESQPSQSKSGGQGQQQAGSPKSGGQQQQQQPQPKKDDQPDFPGKKQIQDANQDQQKAEEEIDKGNNDAAAKKQADASKKLEDAKKKLEELLRQLREEEVERILAALQGRCEKMLAMQKDVREGTVALDKVMKDRSNKQIDPADAQRGLELSDKEKAIVKEADAAIEILRGEGSSVAFPVVFDFVRDLMMNVEKRLRKTDAGAVTVATEDEIIASLEEMIDALKKARKENGQQQQQQGQGGSGQPQNQPLLQEIQELKMIRNMQLRVNRMTETYGKEYKGEQAPAPTKVTTEEKEKAEMLHTELKKLADRQEKIYEVTNDLYKGKNK